MELENLVPSIIHIHRPVFSKTMAKHFRRPSNQQTKDVVRSWLLPAPKVSILLIEMLQPYMQLPPTLPI